MPLARLLLESWDNEKSRFFPVAQVSLLLQVEKSDTPHHNYARKGLVFEYLPTYSGPALDPWLPLGQRERPFIYHLESAEFSTAAVPDEIRGSYAWEERNYRQLPPTLYQFVTPTKVARTGWFFRFHQLNDFELCWLLGGRRRGALRLRSLPGGYLDGMIPPALKAECDPASYDHEAFLATQPTSPESLADYRKQDDFQLYAAFAGECAKIPAQFDRQAWVVKIGNSLNHDLRRDALQPATELGNLSIARAAGLSVLEARVVKCAESDTGLALRDLAVEGPLPEAPPGEVVEPPLKNRVLSLHEILRPGPAHQESPTSSRFDMGWHQGIPELARWLPVTRDNRDELVRRYLIRQFLHDWQGDFTDIMLVAPAGTTTWSLAPLSRLRHSGAFSPMPHLSGTYMGRSSYLGEDQEFYAGVAKLLSWPGLPLTAGDVQGLGRPLLEAIANWQSIYQQAGAEIYAPAHQYTRFPGLRPPEVEPPPDEDTSLDFSLGWADDLTPKV